MKIEVAERLTDVRTFIKGRNKETGNKNLTKIEFLLTQASIVVLQTRPALRSIKFGDFFFAVHSVGNMRA